MIAKGNLHAHGGRLAVYLTKGKDGERAELIDMRGFLSADLREGFRTIQAIAESQTRCEKPFFHAYVRLPEGEGLDHAAWLAVADRIEAHLGFSDQPRAVAFHIAEDGETHMHSAWSRIDTDDMRAIDPGLYKNKLKEICRELEAEYGLQPVKNEREPEQQTKGPARGEFEEARRLGMDVEAIRESIRACYDRSDSGASFVAALSDQGFTLARGDRRDFVVVDHDGGLHALGKRICGERAADVRARIGDDFALTLPTVEEARTQQNEHLHARDTVEPTPANRNVESQNITGEAPIQAPSAIEKQNEERAAIAAKKDVMQEPTEVEIRQQQQREQEQLRQVEAQAAKLETYRKQREAEIEEARKREQERRQQETREKEIRAGDISDAATRHSVALGQARGGNVYQTLADAALAEGAAFKKEQEGLRKEAAAEKDPEKRALIDLRRQIEAHEYMAITSQRLAGISATLAGREDNPIAQRDREQAAAHQARARELREERGQRQAEQERQERERTQQQGAERQAVLERYRAATGRGASEQPNKVPYHQIPATNQRDGLRPDQPAEGAPQTREAREAARANYQRARDSVTTTGKEPEGSGGKSTGRSSGRGGGGRGR